MMLNEQVLIPKCQIAESYFSRFIGLMGKKAVPEDEAICFPCCNSIHTFFMRIPIDVVLVSATGVVVDVLTAIKPWRLMLPKLNAKHIIEMKADRAKGLGIKVGTKLLCSGVWD